MHPPQILSAAATLAALCTLAAPTPAQSPQRTMDTRSLGEVLAQSHGLADVDGTPTAAGPRYLATFRDGIEFTPVLGDTAPRDLPLRLRVVGIRRGDHALDTTPAGAADLDHDRRLVQRRRGDAVTERYAVRAEGVEQSFVFEQQPAGTGDLVVTLQIDSELQGAAAADGTVAFTLPGIGGVHIGQVTGIDAAGRSTPGQLRLRGDRLDLILPDGFVAAAAYPMVLDPLIGTQFLVETGGWNDIQPDVAYDVTNNIYLVVFRRVFGPANIAVRAQRISATGTLIGSFIFIESELEMGRSPTVCNVNLRDRFVIFWERAPILGQADIYCRSLDAATGSTSPILAVATSSSNEINPDAAGDNTTSDDEALVVYEVEGVGIRGTLVTVAADGTCTLAGTQVIRNSTAARRPAISNSQVSTTRYLVVWSDFASSPPLSFFSQIRGRAVNRDFGLLGTEVVLASTSALVSSLDNPAVDGDGSTWLLAYEAGEGLGSSAMDIWCRAVTWTGSTIAAAAATAVDTEPINNQVDPAVGWCGYKYVVLYAAQFLGSANHDIKGVEVGPDCSQCGNPFQLTGLNSTLLRNVEFMPAIASQRSGGGTSGDALIVFAEADDAPPFTSSIIGSRYTALGTGGTITQVGNPCGNPGVIGSSNGAFVVGNTDFRVTLTGTPASAVPFLLLGFAGGEITCGSCVYINSISAQFIPNVGGTAFYNYRLPCNTYPFVGVTVIAQWALFNTGSNPCLAIPGMSFSRRMSLTLGL